MFWFKKKKKEPKMIKVDIYRAYDYDGIPVRCICGSIPLVLRTSPNFPSVIVKCPNYACTMNKYILGCNPKVANRMWNAMIKEIMEE